MGFYINTQRRKHRVVVDITFEEPCTQKYAASFVDRILSCDKSDGIKLVTTWKCKQFNRVFAAELLKWRKKTQLRNQRFPPFRKRRLNP